MSLFWFDFRASYSPVCLGLGVRATSCFILIVLVSCVLRSVLRLLSRYVLFLPAVVPFVSTPLITPHSIYCLCFPLSERLFAYPLCLHVPIVAVYVFTKICISYFCTILPNALNKLLSWCLPLSPLSAPIDLLPQIMREMFESKFCKTFSFTFGVL